MATEEVDKELLKDTTTTGIPAARGITDSSGLSAKIRDFLKNKTENGDKEETWASLTEITAFSLGGFVFFQTRMRRGKYNREREETVLRQFSTDKDAMRDFCARAPAANRIAHDAAALTWGTLNIDKTGDEYVTLGDVSRSQLRHTNRSRRTGKSTKSAENSRPPLVRLYAPPNIM